MKGLVIFYVFFRGLEALWNLSYGNHQYHQDQKHLGDLLNGGSWFSKLLRNAIGNILM